MRLDKGRAFKKKKEISRTIHLKRKRMKEIYSQQWDK
jgi:hypothetical protein